MTPHDSKLAERFRPVLMRREAELRAILRASFVANSEPTDGQDGVTDFKDIAAGQSLDLVDEMQADHAAVELEQVVAALHRVQEGTYGQCLDCGEAIDEARLTAMPAAAFCVACQSVHENARLR